MTCKNCIHYEICIKRHNAVKGVMSCNSFNDCSLVVTQMKDIGKILFVVSKQWISKYEITGLTIHKNHSVSFNVSTVLEEVYEGFPLDCIHEREIGKTAFFSYEEAEQTLKELQNGV